MANVGRSCKTFQRRAVSGRAQASASESQGIRGREGSGRRFVVQNADAGKLGQVVLDREL